MFDEAGFCKSHVDSLGFDLRSCILYFEAAFCVELVQGEFGKRIVFVYGGYYMV